MEDALVGVQAALGVLDKIIFAEKGKSTKLATEYPSLDGDHTDSSGWVNIQDTVKRAFEATSQLASAQSVALTEMHRTLTDLRTELDHFKHNKAAETTKAAECQVASTQAAVLSDMHQSIAHVKKEISQLKRSKPVAGGGHAGGQAEEASPGLERGSAAVESVRHAKSLSEAMATKPDLQDDVAMAAEAPLAAENVSTAGDISPTGHESSRGSGEVEIRYAAAAAASAATAATAAANSAATAASAASAAAISRGEDATRGLSKELDSIKLQLAKLDSIKLQLAKLDSIELKVAKCALLSDLNPLALRAEVATRGEVADIEARMSRKVETEALTALLGRKVAWDDLEPLMLGKVDAAVLTTLENNKADRADVDELEREVGAALTLEEARVLIKQETGPLVDLIPMVKALSETNNYNNYNNNKYKEQEEEVGGIGSSSSSRRRRRAEDTLRTGSGSVTWSRSRGGGGRASCGGPEEKECWREEDGEEAEEGRGRDGASEGMEQQQQQHQQQQQNHAAPPKRAPTGREGVSGEEQEEGRWGSPAARSISSSKAGSEGQRRLRRRPRSSSRHDQYHDSDDDDDDDDDADDGDSPRGSRRPETPMEAVVEEVVRRQLKRLRSSLQQGGDERHKGGGRGRSGDYGFSPAMLKQALSAHREGMMRAVEVQLARSKGDNMEACTGLADVLREDVGRGLARAAGQVEALRQDLQQTKVEMVAVLNKKAYRIDVAQSLKRKVDTSTLSEVEARLLTVDKVAAEGAFDRGLLREELARCLHLQCATAAELSSTRTDLRSDLGRLGDRIRAKADSEQVQNLSNTVSFEAKEATLSLKKGLSQVADREEMKRLVKEEVRKGRAELQHKFGAAEMERIARQVALREIHRGGGGGMGDQSSSPSSAASAARGEGGGGGGGGGVEKRLSIKVAALETSLREKLRESVDGLSTRLLGLQQDLEGKAKEAMAEGAHVAHVERRLDSEMAMLTKQVASCASTGRWLWRSGHLSPGGLVPWEVQVTNAAPDCLLWERSSPSVTSVVPGLYLLSVGFFTLVPVTIRVAVNGEPVFCMQPLLGDGGVGRGSGGSETASNGNGYVPGGGSDIAGGGSAPLPSRSAYTVHRLRHSKGDVTSMKLLEYVALPANAVLSVALDGTKDLRVQGFLSLQKL